MSQTDVSLKETFQKADTAFNSKQFDVAKGLIEGVLEEDPDHEQAHWGLAKIEDALGNVDNALSHLQALIVLKGGLDVIDELAKYCNIRNRMDVALLEYENYLKQHPESKVATFNYAYYLVRGERYLDAIAQYGKALELGIDRPEEVHLNIAKVYSDHLRDDINAKNQLIKSAEVNPNYHPAQFNLGNLAEQQGNVEQATQHFERCLAIDSRHTPALARLAEMAEFTSAGDELIVKMKTASRTSQDAALHFALGNALEKTRDYEEALAALTKANELDSRVYPRYDRAATDRLFEDIKQQFNPAWLTKHRLRGGDAPVFICGMFRSGSTLVEQILAAHPSFTPAGEREFFTRLVANRFPDYPNSATNISKSDLFQWANTYNDESTLIFGTDTRLTDKRPDNFLYLGLIKAMFPTAKIIVTQRRWQDVAFSIYATRLGPAQNYATDLSNTHHYIEQQESLMAHWSELFGSDLHFVPYEKLIESPTETIAALLTFLSEPYDEGCLRFNELKNTVRTASVLQVRKPLYKSAVGRADPFIKLAADRFE